MAKQKSLRSMNAYSFFFKDNLSQVMKSENLKSATEAAKVVGKSWMQLSDQDKLKYKEKARIEKEKV